MNYQLNIINDNDNYECSICLNKIEKEIINCDRCTNKNCLECFKQIEKTIKFISNKDIKIIHYCPICKIEVSMDLINLENIIKFDLLYNINNYITELNKNLIHTQINNNILLNKIQYLIFYIKYIYNIIKFIFIQIKKKYCFVPIKNTNKYQK